MPDHYFLICSDLSHSFSDSTGFLFLDLASEAQEAQAARLFLFSCREALFSPAFLTCSFFCFLFLFPFLTCHRMQFGAPCIWLFCPVFFLFFPCIFDELTDRIQQKSTCSGEGPTTSPQARNGRRRPGSVAVDTGASCEFVLFPFYSGRGFIFHFLPRPCIIPNNWLYFLCWSWIIGEPESNVSHPKARRKRGLGNPNCIQWHQ